jgi:hypothetical protein
MSHVAYELGFYIPEDGILIVKTVKTSDFTFLSMRLDLFGT